VLQGALFGPLRDLAVFNAVTSIRRWVR